MMTLMRTIIDLPPSDIDALDALCRREGISRAEAIRRAVAQHLLANRTGDADMAFGLWRARPVDGLRYQRRLRREWDGDK
jgi:metal-responsive CopG/Arc/MetJ family transcriptional regulator